MSRQELNEHRSYWRDVAKVDAYRRALREVVTPESVVLDLGCGTGLLGLLACEAGARRVYAIDGGSIIHAARSIAAASPFADRIVHVQGFSTKVELPELVDVVVADQIGGLAYDAGTNEYFADARARLAKPGAVFVPAGFELRLTPVAGADDVDEVQFWRSSPLGYDVSSVASVAANVVRSVSRRSTDLSLGDPVVFASVASWDASPIEAKVTLSITRAGVLAGLLGTFVATMSPGVTMTNDPSLPDPMRERWQNFLAVESPVAVVPGDEVVVSVRADPLSYHITWSVEVRRGGERLQRTTQSSALGMFLGADDLKVAAAPPERIGLWRAALDLVEAGCTEAEIARQLRGAFAEQLSSDREAGRFASEVWSAVR